MAQPVYATVANYTDFLDPDPVPVGAARHLREASREIDQMLLCSVYEVDATGAPTDADVIEALKDATCAQAEYAKAIGDAKSVGGKQFHSMSLGSAQLTRGYSPRGSAAPNRWSRKAWEILQRAGLVGHEPQTW